MLALAPREVLMPRRDGARLFSGRYLTDVSILESQNCPFASLVASGVVPDTAVEISGRPYSYTIGTTIEE